MPDNAYLSGRDIMEIFGLNNNAGIDYLIAKGYLPEPSIRNTRQFSLGRKPLRNWSKKQIVEAVGKYLAEYFPDG